MLAQSADRCGAAARDRVPSGTGQRGGKSEIRCAGCRGGGSDPAAETAGVGLRFVVAGSTLEGEEAALLEAWPRVLEADAGPGHGAGAAASRAIWRRWPRCWTVGHRVGSAVGVEESRRRNGRWRRDRLCCWIRSASWLRCIRWRRWRLWGEALSEAGGHNPLEPAQFGVPIVMGPHYANFRAITEDLRAHDALRIARGRRAGRSAGGVADGSDEAQAMGQRARQVFEQQAGATARSRGGDCGSAADLRC